MNKSYDFNFNPKFYRVIRAVSHVRFDTASSHVFFSVKFKQTT